MTLFESRPPAPRHPGGRNPSGSLRGTGRRRARSVWAALGTIAAVVGITVVTLGPDRVATSVQQLFPGEAPTPAAELVAVADQSFLTEEGRAVLYDARPTLVDLEEIATVCPVAEDGGSALGCYASPNAIFIYRPADARLQAAMVTTLAHEMLHAAYAKFSSEELVEVVALLQVAIAQVPPEDVVHSQIEASMGGHAWARDTETFAYLGSQIYPDGGFAPELEAIFGRFISDRPALVDVHRQYEAVLQGVVTEYQSAVDQLAADDAANRQSRAQWEADRAAHEASRQAYIAQADQFNAYSPAEQATWTATWTRSDGTTVTLPLGEALSRQHAELEAFRAELDSRAAALDAAESAVEARRPQVEAQWADVQALLRAAYPGAPLG